MEVQYLTAYNGWKKGTLNRVANTATRESQRHFQRYLSGLKGQMEDAMVSGYDLPISRDDLSTGLSRVYENYFNDTVMVGVSDAFREVTPEASLGTWLQYPMHIPVEHTFVSLSDKRKRNIIYKKIVNGFGEKRKTWLDGLLSEEVDRRLYSISKIFQSATKDYFDNPDTTDSKEQINKALKRILKVNQPGVERVFRTQTTDIFNHSRVGYFQNNTGVDFLEIFAVTDGRISNICEVRHGYVMPVAYGSRPGYAPPYHFNCRTILSPLNSLIKRQRRIIKRGLGAEFGLVLIKGEEERFRGRVNRPSVPLPNGWRSSIAS